jgi:hypothetical protein
MNNQETQGTTNDVDPASVDRVVHTPGPWDYSEQKGGPGHCFVAQVWDSEGESLAVLDSTIDPAVATANAKLMASSPELLYCLQRLLPMVNDYDFRCSPEGKVLSDRINALLAKVV